MNKQYKELLREILDEGYQYTDTKRDVQCKQIDHKILDINLQEGFPAINLKKLYWKGVVAELLWFLRGDTNIKYLVDNGVNIWNKDAYNYYLKQIGKNNEGKYYLEPMGMNTFLERVKDNKNYEKSRVESYNYKLGDLGRIYGAQWRKFRSDYTFDMEESRFMYGGRYPTNIRYKYLDQISNLIKNLKEQPMSRRHIVTAWNPAELDDIALPSCHWSFEIIVRPLSQKERINYYDKINKPIFYVLYKKIDFFDKYLDKANIPKYSFTLKWHQRSCDTFLGITYNTASYALLAHIIGKLTNMVPNRLIGDLSNVHLYENSWKASRELIKRDPTKYDLPKLKDFDGFKLDMHDNFSQWINSKEISDFQLENYKSYPNIKVEMLSPK